MTHVLQDHVPLLSVSYPSVLCSSGEESDDDDEFDADEDDCDADDDEKDADDDEKDDDEDALSGAFSFLSVDTCFA